MKTNIIMISIVLIVGSIMYFTSSRIMTGEDNMKRFREECRDLGGYAIIYRKRVWNMQCVNQDETKILIPTKDVYTYEDVKNTYN